MKEKILSFVKLKAYFRGEPCSFLEFYVTTMLTITLFTVVTALIEMMIMIYFKFPLPLFTAFVAPNILWLATLIQYFRHRKHLFEDNISKIFLVLAIIPFTFRTVYFNFPFSFFGGFLSIASFLAS